MPCVSIAKYQSPASIRTRDTTRHRSCEYEVQVMIVARVCEISSGGRLHFGREVREGLSEVDLRRINGKLIETGGKTVFTGS